MADKLPIKDLFKKFSGEMDSFISDESRHSLSGVRQLVEMRREFIAGIESAKKNEMFDPEQTKTIDNYTEKLKNQDEKIESIVRGIQKEILENINEMRSTQRKIRVYKSRVERKPQFIDKKR